MNENEPMRRDTPEPAESRAAEVKRIQAAVKEDIKHWEYAFNRMEEWRKFARGYQWPESSKEDGSDPDRRYVVNIVMRHIQQRTAAMYAKNPRFRWRRSKQMLTQVWDGTRQQLEMAMATLAPQEGMPPPDPQSAQSAQAVISDALQSQAVSDANRKFGETLSILYEYQIGEQTHPTKKMMKKQVRAALTTGVAYIKQTFQRSTKLSPDGENAIADHMSRLGEIQRLAEDLDEGEFTEAEAEMEQLTQLIKSIEEAEQIIVREGIALDYPDSLNIIPDSNLEYLPGFVGCDRVTEQYCLTKDQIKKIYRVDVGSDFTPYVQNDQDTPVPERKTARVWEVWDRSTGLVTTVCDGYPDYLVEPAEPDAYTERFFPWFVLAPNAMDAGDDPFPASDVELMMSQQMEINRAGEALREHRWAARPGHIAARNIPDSDTKSISGRQAHDVIVLESLAQGEKIGDMLQAFPTSPIDPNLYNTGPAFQDVLRAVGTQEANLGGASGATATESSIAESSRQSVLSSMMDEFDDLLTEMARAGGQILLTEMSEQQVEEIVGAGAMWREMDRQQVAREIELEVEAGSSGLPNQAVEVQMIERLFPLLIQMPNVDPEWALKKLLTTLDDRLRVEDAIKKGELSIQALNGQLQGAANRGASPMAGGEGGSQGGGGEANAPQPDMPQQNGPQGARVPVTGSPV